MRLGFPFSVYLPFSHYLSLSLYLSNTEVHFPHLYQLVRSSFSFSFSLSCYSASIDSGVDHLIHPICIPLMLPVGRVECPHETPRSARTHSVGPMVSFIPVHSPSRSSLILRSMPSLFMSDFHKSVPKLLCEKNS